MSKSQTSTPLYKSLAYVYDDVMDEVDYDEWADFLDEVIQTHHHDPIDILELACGTGSISLSLDELMCYNITGTDRSPEMIEIARQKSHQYGTHVQFEVMDFLDLDLEKKYDVALCIFDSINYLHRPDKVNELLEEVYGVLKPGGLFVFDFTTPRNSQQAIQFLDDEDGYASETYYYHRQSDYDRENRIHTNTFTIQRIDQDSGRVLETRKEIHHQRIYSISEMDSIINGSRFQTVAKYEGFDLIDADEESLRITTVLRCPKTPL